MVRPPVGWLKQNFAYTMAGRQVPDSRHHNGERLGKIRSPEKDAISAPHLSQYDGFRMTSRKVHFL
jgi:hypothetical protein